MSIVFMGSPHFALPSLGKLLSAGYKVAAVYTQPDRVAGRGQKVTSSPVKRFALEKGLPVMQPSTLRNAEEHKRLAALVPDVVIVAAYGLILPREVLSLPPRGCLNLHPSLLPRYRGPSPVASAILAGNETTGVSVMLLDEGMDTGPVLAQLELSISPEDTTGTLTEKLAEAGAELLVKTLPLWFRGSIKPQPQDDAQAVYSRMITKEMGEIDWQRPALELGRQVRAFQPWPGSYTWWKGKRLEILRASPLPGGSGITGRVIAVPLQEQPKTVASPGAIGVETSQGVLCLQEIQWEGKRPLSGVEFWRGQQDFLGARLPLK